MHPQLRLWLPRGDLDQPRILLPRHDRRAVERSVRLYLRRPRGPWSEAIVEYVLGLAYDPKLTTQDRLRWLSFLFSFQNRRTSRPNVDAAIALAIVDLAEAVDLGRPLTELDPQLDPPDEARVLRAAMRRLNHGLH